MKRLPINAANIRYRRLFVEQSLANLADDGSGPENADGFEPAVEVEEDEDNLFNLATHKHKKTEEDEERRRFCNKEEEEIEDEGDDDDDDENIFSSLFD